MNPIQGIELQMQQQYQQDATEFGVTHGTKYSNLILCSSCTTWKFLLPHTHAQGLKQLVLSVVCLHKIGRSQHSDIMLVRKFVQIVGNCQKLLNTRYSPRVLRQILNLYWPWPIDHSQCNTMCRCDATPQALTPCIITIYIFSCSSTRVHTAHGECAL